LQLRFQTWLEETGEEYFAFDHLQGMDVPLGLLLTDVWDGQRIWIG
jgi:hypothetical protein